MTGQRGHMAAGDPILLDNGNRLFVHSISFGSDPRIALGTKKRKKWWLRIGDDPAIVWLIEYGAWRVSGVSVRLYPIFNEAVLRRAAAAARKAFLQGRAA